ncbi:molecular chaperone GrpE (heat shock protein) [Thermanaerovibrio velox DSM 12556]|uniref:Protein GrpE n=1 Tax=Thermanaerovibrio velox DSM 12556 TaxID=926567 RepID=H0USL2_9BACT|nr:nucleotide exchange factor GrpE [Thermanaerovibrio velox]EHM10301.1 molecular chaperone GrpE (heat shock protein) [Thermanaerovibrio velox DSM 12556]
MEENRLIDAAFDGPASQEGASPSAEVSRQEDLMVAEMSKVELVEMLRGKDRDIKRMEEELSKLKDSYDDLMKEALRNKADFTNYVRRVERDREVERKRSAESAVGLLIPVLDNLERTLLSCTDRVDDPVIKGVQMVARQFLSALESLGLERVASEGAFDPSVHEAVDFEETGDPEMDGKVVAELQRGYLLGGKLIRPALVKVAKFKG